MTIHVKSDSVWKDVKNIFVKKDGVWTNVKEGHIKEGGVWKPFFLDVFNFSITSNLNNTNLRSLAVAAGWDENAPLLATVNSGVYISSNSTSTPALTVSGSFPGGVTLANNGYIIGLGGNGGRGGNERNAGTAGTAGGTAMLVSSPLSIINNQTIAGGGGGGGGGGAIYFADPEGVFENYPYDGWAGGGGGGGRGTPVANTTGGAAGVGDPQASRIATAGSGGTFSSAGAAGLGSLSPNGAYGGGNGGAGGSWGYPGSDGGRGFIHDGTYYIGYFGGAGGAAGNAVSGNSYVTWLTVGNRLGGLV
jgi:hypothetical protein